MLPILIVCQRLAPVNGPQLMDGPKMRIKQPALFSNVNMWVIDARHGRRSVVSCVITLYCVRTRGKSKLAGNIAERGKQFSGERQATARKRGGRGGKTE